MAVIEKRGDAWRVRITRTGFPRESATFPTRAKADAWARQREGELLTAKRGGIIRRTVKQALEKYRDEVAPTHRGARWERVRCDKLARELPFRHRALPEIRPRDIAEWRDAALAGSDDRAALAPASVRREMGLLRLIFERCRLEWGWLASNPMDGVKRPPSAPARQQTASADDVAQLLEALGYAPGARAETLRERVAVAILFALETGMRAGEICGIHRRDVHTRHVHLRRTKNDSERSVGRDVPLSKAAAALLALLNPGNDPVFALKPSQIDSTFRAAREAAGIVGLHFHDLRATAITRLSKRLDVLELARMIGHRDLKSLQIYYRPTAAELADRLD